MERPGNGLVAGKWLLSRAGSYRWASGGIGRRTGLKIPWPFGAVGVRIPPRPPSTAIRHHAPLLSISQIDSGSPVPRRSMAAVGSEANRNDPNSGPASQTALRCRAAGPQEVSATQSVPCDLREARAKAARVFPVPDHRERAAEPRPGPEHPGAEKKRRLRPPGGTEVRCRSSGQDRREPAGGVSRLTPLSPLGFDDPEKCSLCIHWLVAFYKADVRLSVGYPSPDRGTQGFTGEECRQVNRP